MKYSPITRIIYITIVLIISALACSSGTSDSGSLVESAPEQANGNSEASPTESGPTFFVVGDLVEVKDQLIALTSVELIGTTLIATFKVKNTGSEELTLSTFLSFSAKNDQSELLEEDIFDCGPSLGGTIVSGDVVTGQICWNGGSFPARIYYDPSLFGSGTVVWDVPQAATSDISLDADDLKSFAKGDVVEINNLTISLVEITIVNGRLTATFLIENIGTEELIISSFLSFDAKDSNGASLEMDIFDCSPGLDGTVVAGDMLRGSICWIGAAYPLTLYYDASLFGSGTIVWELTE